MLMPLALFRLRERGGRCGVSDMSRKFKNMLSLQSPLQQLGRLKTVYYLLFFCLLSHALQAQCWQTVAAGIDHTIAIRPDGSLWAWGFNGSGQLGDGSLQNRGTPVQICTDTDWKVISAAGNQSFAIKTDGTLWAWGDNLWGELCLGDVWESEKYSVKSWQRFGLEIHFCWQNIFAGDQK